MWRTSSLQTKCDDERLPWLSLGWAQVRELLCPLLSVAWASEAKHVCCCCCTVLSWTLLTSWQMLGSYAHLPEHLERKGKTEESLLAYSSLSTLPLAGRWLVTTWKKDPKLQCKSLNFSAWIESTKQFLVTLCIKGWDGPRADIKLETSCLDVSALWCTFMLSFYSFLLSPWHFQGILPKLLYWCSELLLLSATEQDWKWEGEQEGSLLKVESRKTAVGCSGIP